MKAVSSQVMRELDRRTIEEHGVAGELLMERAGAGVADIVEDILHLSGGRRGDRVIVVAGHGNNGGDAFVAARCLKERGYVVDVYLAGRVEQIKGDALLHLERMRAAGVELREGLDDDGWDELILRNQGGGIVVDGVLGTGISGAVRGAAALAIKYINLLGERNLVVSIDVPSGLDADSGTACGDAVRADVTVTMGLPKKGLLEQAAADHVGSVRVVDIGIPDVLLADLPDDVREFVAESEVARLIGRRRHGSHKGTYGHVLIIGGAPGYSGAVALAGMAAVRSGAGLVTALVPAGVVDVVAKVVPEMMVHPGVVNESGSLAAGCLEEWKKSFDGFDSILVGPGMTTHGDSAWMVRKILGEGGVPVIVDADALNVCAGDLKVFKSSKRQVILTPHPGELARLMGCTTEEIQSDREGSAMKAARESGAVVVLKGTGTVVCSVDGRVVINRTGNAGMATGGSGDVLGGVVAALTAGGLTPYDAACAGVLIHGIAGDMAAFSGSQAGMTAGDIALWLPRAFGAVCGR